MKSLFHGKLLALAAVLVLAACGSGGGKAAPSGEQAPAGKNTPAETQSAENTSVQAPQGSAQDDLMRLLLVEGEGSVTQGGSTKEFKDQPADQIIESGATVTTKPVSWADIQLGGGGKACLGTTSEVVITTTDSGMHFDLEKGRILFDTVQTDGNTAFEFATESAVLTFTRASGLISVNKEKRSSSIYLTEGEAAVTGIRPDGRLTAEKELEKGTRLIFAPTNEEDTISTDATPLKEKNYPWNFWHSMMYHEDMLDRLVADGLLDADALIEAANAEAEENKDPALTAWLAERRGTPQEAGQPEETAAEEAPRLDAFIERCEKGVTMDVEVTEKGSTYSMTYVLSGKNRYIDLTDIYTKQFGNKYSSVEVIRNENGAFLRARSSDKGLEEIEDLTYNPLEQYSFLDYDAEKGDLVTGIYMEDVDYNGRTYHAEYKWLYTYLFEGDTLCFVNCRTFPDSGEPGAEFPVIRAFKITDIREGADGSFFESQRSAPRP